MMAFMRMLRRTQDKAAAAAARTLIVVKSLRVVVARRLVSAPQDAGSMALGPERPARRGRSV